MGDDDETYEVGDVKTLDNHIITLKDPNGRIGYYWNCEKCGGWYADYAVFKTESCSP